MIQNVTYETRKAFLKRWTKKKCCLHVCPFVCWLAGLLDLYRTLLWDESQPRIDPLNFSVDPDEETDPRTFFSFAPSTEYDLVLFSRFSIGSSVGGLKVLTLCNSVIWGGIFGSEHSQFESSSGPLVFPPSVPTFPVDPPGLINALDTKSAVKRFGFPLWETHIC